MRRHNPRLSAANGLAHKARSRLLSGCLVPRRPRRRRHLHRQRRLAPKVCSVSLATSGTKLGVVGRRPRPRRLRRRTPDSQAQGRRRVAQPVQVAAEVPAWVAAVCSTRPPAAVVTPAVLLPTMVLAVVGVVVAPAAATKAAAAAAGLASARRLRRTCRRCVASSGHRTVSSCSRRRSRRRSCNRGRPRSSTREAQSGWSVRRRSPGDVSCWRTQSPSSWTTTPSGS
mmetsp:Transcript_75210/g.244585  ORF Transcript_75210/g.244585 Transcript_75210/m.244585 type:complete len:227 (-) Transcript_75210:4296-4976(-)